MPKTFTKVVADTKSLRVIPEQTMMLCEQPGCGREIRMADAWSYPAVMALSGPDIHISLVCEEEQHFGCSHECAIALHNDCVAHHLLPRFQEALRNQQSNATYTYDEQPASTADTKDNT